MKTGAVDMPVGSKYGKWTIIGEPIRGYKNRALHYLCRCDCGTERVVSGVSLRNGGWHFLEQDFYKSAVYDGRG